MTTYTYCHAELRPTENLPLNTGPVFGGLPEGVELTELNFQGASDLGDDTEYALISNYMVWRVAK